MIMLYYKGEEVLIGAVFNDLTIININPSLRGSRQQVTCLCSCGVVKDFAFNTIASGNTKSCGCRRINTIASLNKTHGLSNTYLYTVYMNMIKRCYNEKSKDFTRYGGRGIKVCEEWQDVAVFIEWALNSGYSQGLTIERKCTNSDYTPDNCRWATRCDQMVNREICSNNTSGYIGVKINGSNWCWKITYNKINYSKSGFKSAKDAAFARNLFIRKNRIPATLNSIDD